MPHPQTHRSCRALKPTRDVGPENARHREERSDAAIHGGALPSHPRLPRSARNDVTLRSQRRSAWKRTRDAAPENARHREEHSDAAIHGRALPSHPRLPRSALNDVTLRSQRRRACKRTRHAGPANTRHREERSDAAIHDRALPSRPRLPRFARNDEALRSRRRRYACARNDKEWQLQGLILRSPITAPWPGAPRVPSAAFFLGLGRC